MTKNEINGLIEGLNSEFPSLTLGQRVQAISRRFRGAVLTTGLGPEGQAISWAIAQARHRTGAQAGAKTGSAIRLATLQTGRLFPETLDLLQSTRRRTGLVIEEFHPAADAEQAYVAAFGMDGFYESRQARDACCGFRKLEPLERALAGADAWITGLRREQSAGRSDIPFAKWDSSRKLVKINPLADWSSSDLDEMIAANDIPINPLHRRGYRSIGCAPCTRAVKPGEPDRAGRWWWESDDSRECGLHTAAKKADFPVAASAIEPAASVQPAAA